MVSYIFYPSTIPSLLTFVALNFYFIIAIFFCLCPRPKSPQHFAPFLPYQTHQLSHLPPSECLPPLPPRILPQKRLWRPRRLPLLSTPVPRRGTGLGRRPTPTSTKVRAIPLFNCNFRLVLTPPSPQAGSLRYWYAKPGHLRLVRPQCIRARRHRRPSLF